MAADESVKRNEILQLKKETEIAFQEWLDEATEDYEFVLGNQWSDSDRAKLQSEKRPILSLNNIKKPIDLISGFQRQNKTDIRILPIEATDQINADVLSEVIKWVMIDGGGTHKVSTAFYDTLSVGAGWIHPTMDFKDDMVNGDIKLKVENPFRILPDYEFTEQDLSDAQYVFRHAWISKNAAIQLYPEFKADIEKLSGGNVGQFRWQQPERSTSNQIGVVEYWYRKLVKKKFLADMGTGDVTEWIGRAEGLGKIENMIKTNPQAVVPNSQTEVDPAGVPFGRLKVIRMQVSTIRLTSIIEEKFVVYDDVNPFGIDMYPFIPFFGYYVPSFNKWVWKLQGVARTLKDSQREKNKRRSKLLHSAMTLPYSSWLYRDGSVQDPKVFKSAGQTSQAIKFHGETPPTQIQPQQISPALVQLEQMHDNDMRTIGPNADLLGLSGQQGGSGQSAPGITLQLRQKQGLTSIQNLFDNLSFGKELLGKYLIQLIFNNFDESKIRRIINRELPPGFFEGKDVARYNLKVDEVANSPTYRAYNFTVLAALAKEGHQIPPDVLMEFSDIPQETKDRLAQSAQAASEAQQQAQQAEEERKERELRIKEGELQLKFKELELKAFEAGIKLDSAALEQDRVDIEKARVATQMAESMGSGDEMVQEEPIDIAQPQPQVL
jgi:hypothetical protein